MSKVFEVFAALTMDTSDFDRAVSHATRAGRTLSNEVRRAMAAAARSMSQSAASSASAWRSMAATAQSSMSQLRASVTGTWHDVADAIQKAIDKAQLFFSLGGDNPPTVPGFDTGLDYVPYDNFIARLHKGETVLTRLEADQWRAGERSLPVSADPAQMAEAVRRALSGLTVELDGRTVGRMVAPTVSAVMGSQTRARRYTG